MAKTVKRTAIDDCIDDCKDMMSWFEDNYMKEEDEYKNLQESLVVWEQLKRIQSIDINIIED